MNPSILFVPICFDRDSTEWSLVISDEYEDVLELFKHFFPEGKVVSETNEISWKSDILSKDEDAYPVIIGFCHCEFLLEGDTAISSGIINSLTSLKMEGGHEVRPVSRLVERNSIRKIQSGYPMILVTDADLEDGSIFKEKLISGIDFFDSSIWHRYFSYSVGARFKEEFEILVKEILWNYEHNLYYGASANESLEYQLRQFQNNYLVNLSSGHSFIKPVKFFSESRYQKLLQDKLCSTDNNLSKLTMGALIIDDYYDKNMNLLSAKSEVPTKPKRKKFTKSQVVQGIINRVLTGISAGQVEDDLPAIQVINIQEAKKDSTKAKDGEDPDKAVPVEEEKRENKDYIKEGKSLIQEYPNADIILLDFYLGNDEEKGMIHSGMEIVRSLITEPKTEEPQIDLRFNKPFDKFWVFPISAFDFAFRNELVEFVETDNQLEFATGADPITTPYQFVYMLMRMMERQVSLLEFKEKEVFAILNSTMKGLGDSPEGMNNSTPKSSNASMVMFLRIARKIMNHFILKEKHIHSIKSKTEGSVGGGGKEWSLLAGSYYEREKKNENKLLLGLSIHFQHLLYLVNFEGRGAKNRIKEEYHLIESIFKRYRDNHAQGNTISRPDIANAKKLSDSVTKFNSNLRTLKNWIKNRL